MCTVNKRFFSFAPRLCGKSLEPHRVDSERRHLLPTQHAQQGQGGCASCLRGGRRRERRSVFVSATSSVAGMPRGNRFFIFALCKSLFSSLTRIGSISEYFSSLLIPYSRCLHRNFEFLKNPTCKRTKKLKIDFS